MQLAVELGDDQPDRLGRAGRGGDQVDRGGARPAQVLVGHVLQALVGGVGVDRGHQAVLDADRLVQHLGHRGQAVGRAGGVGDDLVLLAVVGLGEVDAEHDGRVRVGRRRGDDDLLGPGVEVLGGVLAVGEQAGGLDHHVGAELAPGQRRRDRARPARGSPGRRRAGRWSVASHLARERPVGRVVLEQVGDRLGIDEVVDGEPLDVGPALVGGPEDVPADPSEAVDTDTYSHACILQIQSLAVTKERAGRGNAGAGLPDRLPEPPARRIAAHRRETISTRRPSGSSR